VELLLIEYAGGDRIFVPFYRLSQLQKYTGKDATPKLDRLGGSTFRKTKARVRRRVREMADELLRLYADRAHIEKLPLPRADDEYAAFEAQFAFEETADQAAAISDVLQDLEKAQVMDRLVCGDVGFGKTEVAIRAAFRHAMAGHQVALLCPTTVLAQQHTLTFTQRFRSTPIRVRGLSRFQNSAEQREVIEQLRAGRIDVVVGTHRLLSRDVHFKDLGLLIIDEEQRFGVTHKERIKQLRTNVDVLTLTATPIPRTLQLAVGGLRDLSVINTPPEDRRAIRTLIARYDDATVRDAVRRELQRGGQVYYVYNRVEDIHQRAQRVAQLVPEARIAVAHGQMSETALEKAMLGFVRGDTDVLVCTAIVESGLDIPRANTMLIERAELFGLAQLHQLRGRVGRSPLRAYCYLLVPAPSELSGEARARIEALARYSELGSGLNLATLDMELRGAGNLLGAEQSGSVASVGLQLFCQMLAEASDELRGIPVIQDIDPELSFDVEALLPESYIEDVGLRLSLYKRLASAGDDNDVLALGAEMEDRFGPPPPSAQRLLELMRIKVELRRLRVLACEASARGVTLHLSDDTPLDRDKLRQLVTTKGSRYRITPDRRLSRRLSEGDPPTNSIALTDKTLSELSALC
jgi:transcription-repair coupling factor (superfamily II helicase)